MKTEEQTPTQELSENEKKAQQYIIKSVEDAFNILDKHFNQYCNEVAPKYNGGNYVTSVPIAYIRQAFKTFLENYKKGAVL